MDDLGGRSYLMTPSSKSFDRCIEVGLGKIKERYSTVAPSFPFGVAISNRHCQFGLGGRMAPVLTGTTLSTGVGMSWLLTVITFLARAF